MHGILRLISFAREVLIVGTRAHFSRRGIGRNGFPSFNSRLSVGKQHTASYPLGTGFCLKFKRLPRVENRSIRDFTAQSPKLQRFTAYNRRTKHIEYAHIFAKL